VTGGTGAFGRAITDMFIASDATTVSSYIVDKELEQLTKEEL
jgi:NAD(P)-dependent dehydrogenase (short-subunit alcohol dehydrogenase family)